MKKVKMISSLMIVLLIFCVSVLPVFSLTRYNVFVEEYDEEATSKIWDNINLESSDALISNAPHIFNMDVSESGKVAVTLTSMAQDCVAVFDENGTFIKSFTYDSSGSVYVAWNNENLVLFFVRGGGAFEFSLDGEPVAAYSYFDDSICRDLEQNSIEMNGSVYEVKRDSILTKTDATGNEIVIYKSIVAVPNWLIFALAFIIFFIICACVILRQMLHPKTEEKTTQPKV